MFNKTKISLEKLLQKENQTPINFEDYIESLVEEDRGMSIPVDLSKILAKRRIEEIKITPYLLHPVLLELDSDTRFILRTKIKLDFTNPEHRLLIAHEIGHTYIFDISKRFITPNLNLSTSSLQQEFLANFVGRCLLIPKKSLIAKLPQEIKDLSIFNSLIDYYNVPYQELLTRIFNDCKLLPNMAIVRFIKFYGENKWRLYEHFVPERLEYNKKYFIPRKNFKSEVPFKQRFPSCSDELNEYFDKLSLIDDKWHIVHKEDLSHKPLKTFMGQFENQELDITAKRKEHKKYKSQVINMMIKFNMPNNVNRNED